MVDEQEPDKMMSVFIAFDAKLSELEMVNKIADMKDVKEIKSFGQIMPKVI